MNFEQLAWSAVCYYYRSIGDKKYINIMANTSLIRRLREDPCDISCKEIEEKLILGYLKIENYDVLLHHNLARAVLQTFFDIKGLTAKVQDQTILEANLLDGDPASIGKPVNEAYNRFCAIKGLWSTGASKLLHLLNDRLFPVVTPDTMAQFNLMPQRFQMAEFMKLVQRKAIEATTDFHRISNDVTVDAYLSEKMGYARKGCHKSLVKFIDEYYCMVSEGLRIPPIWTPGEDLTIAGQRAQRP